MKILSDENLPNDLRLLIAGHEVATVAYQGWAGRRNGELLHVAEDSGFDLLITADQEIPSQQNFRHRKIALLVLGTNDWPSLGAAVPGIRDAVNQMVPGTVRFVEIPDLPPSLH